MVKADTNYDKRVFVVIGGGECLLEYVMDRYSEEHPEPLPLDKVFD